MRFKHHIKRLELQASECQRSLDEVAETHRGLRARALAVNHIVDQAEALLACAEALAAEGEPTPSSSGTCPTPPRHAVGDAPALQTPSVSWWPAGAEHLAAASRIDSVEALRHSSQSTVQAIGILLP